jgi:hypothetical protein
MSSVTESPAVRATDYALTASEAEYLKAVCLLPAAERAELLARYSDEHGTAALLHIFTAFVGLANSVVANNREACEMILIIDGHMWPEQAAHANLPTIFGALQGVQLAARVRQSKTCQGCAFRLGTCANQSPITTADAIWCEETDDAFLCHERGLDADGNPTRACVGYAQVFKEQKP